MSTTSPPAEGAPLDGRFATFSFAVDEQARELGLSGAHFVMGGLINAAAHDEFDELLGHALDALDDATNNGYEPRTDPVLAGYRTLHAAVGRSNRDHVSSAENLQRLVKMNGTIPRTNLIVDVQNLISLRTRLSISVHDLAAVEGDVRLVRTTGRERFVRLPSEQPRPVYPGEYAYVDSAGSVICRMETRQAASTRPGLATSECFYIVHGNRATTEAYLSRAAADLVRLTTYFCGGYERALTPQR